MEERRKRNYKKAGSFAAIVIVVNLLALFCICGRIKVEIGRRMAERTGETGNLFGQVMGNYEHSFQLFAELMKNEIKNNPDPDVLWDFLKSIDTPMKEIEGDTFDGLYMYYKGRYLYSWDTPYSQYEETGYVATERPWYLDAEKGGGEIVFTPPYMSYANHYILTTLSQMQPDGETVFAYDIRMGDIQKLVSSGTRYQDEQIFIYDQNGTVVGSTDTRYLGGSLYENIDVLEQAVRDGEQAAQAAEGRSQEQLAKETEQLESAAAFLDLRRSFDGDFEKLCQSVAKPLKVSLDGKQYFGILDGQGGYSFLVLIPVMTMLRATIGIWLVPLLIVEILLIYILGSISRGMKNRELKRAYIELGQTQKRLELALNAAQKAAAIDELTGLMNFKSFRTETENLLSTMDETDHGILIMMDGDHFKQVNDNFGHSTGDDVIRLCAQMMIGRIRLVDLASRLHGDEFAIFVSNTSDYSVAKGIISDINASMEKEAKKRGLPVITMSAGAVIARRGDTYNALAKAADEALYRAKETHNGAIAYQNQAE